MSQIRIQGWVLVATALSMGDALSGQAVSFQKEVVTVAGSVSASILPPTSINNLGDVAFTGLVGSGMNLVPHVFARLANSSVTDISPGLTTGTSQDLGNSIQIADDRQVLVRRFYQQPAPIAPIPVSRLEIWDGTAPGTNTILQSGVPLAGFWSGIYPWATRNNRGSVLFSGIQSNSNALATLTSPASCASGLNCIIGLGGFPVPTVRMDDDNYTVMRIGDQTGTIRVFPPAFGASAAAPVIFAASASVGGFLSVGANPGISDAGSPLSQAPPGVGLPVVAFCGDNGSGLGIYLSVPNPNGRRTVTVAGGGLPDGFTGFVLDAPVGVQCLWHPSLFDDRLTTLVFVGSRGSQSGVWAVDVFTEESPISNAFESRIGTPHPVALVGETVQGLAINSIELWDPLNNCGEVVMQAITSGGSAVILGRRAGPWPQRRVRLTATRVLNGAGAPGSFAGTGSPFQWTPGTITAVVERSAQLLMSNANVELVLEVVQDISDVLDPSNPTGYPSLFDCVTSSLLAHEANIRSDPIPYGWDGEAVNVYFTNTLNGGDFGLSATPYRNVQRNMTLVAAENTGTTLADQIEARAQTLAHELGHHFNLLHTHESQPSAEGPIVAGTGRALNAGTAGDQVCDTPPDPDLSTAMALSGVYPAGTPEFAVLTTNIMSYYRGNRTLLTAGQVARLHQGIDLFRRSELANETSPGSATPVGSGCQGPTTGGPRLWATPAVNGRAVWAWMSDLPPNVTGTVYASLVPQNPTPVSANCAVHLDLSFFLPIASFSSDATGSATVKIISDTQMMLPVGFEVMVQGFMTVGSSFSLTNGVRITVGG